jgi:hypothetical protein
MRSAAVRIDSREGINGRLMGQILSFSKIQQLMQVEMVNTL